MAKQNHSTEIAKAVSRAPGALSVCPASLILDSGPNASQTLASEGEPDAAPPTCPIGSGPSMTRRILMNSLVALPIVSALPVANISKSPFRSLMTSSSLAPRLSLSLCWPRQMRRSSRPAKDSSPC
jgi:hypothetical protein